MIIFVNGKIGFGSPPPGRPFWGSDRGFVRGAEEFFSDARKMFLSVDYSWLSTVGQRTRQGRDKARGLALVLEPEEKVHIVTFSMGAAYGEGLAQGLHEQGLRLGWMVHLCPYQAGAMLAGRLAEFTVEYQLKGDPVSRNPLLSVLGNRVGHIRSCDHYWMERSPFRNPLVIHRSPIWWQQQHFWRRLKGRLGKTELRARN